MKINSRGYWENDTADGHGHDEKLALAIAEFFRDEDYYLIVADVGCGDGYYSSILESFGVDSTPMDGNPNTPKITMDKYGVESFIMDFSRYVSSIISGRYYDWLLCLEVGEHIPQEYEQIFLDNLEHMANEGIILSWAIEGQDGDGHVNCRNNDYIISEMEKRGFCYSELETVNLRSNCSPYPETGWWFKNTLMVFRRK